VYFFAGARRDLLRKSAEEGSAVARWVWSSFSDVGVSNGDTEREEMYGSLRDFERLRLLDSEQTDGERLRLVDSVLCNA
jgi:hypothetical protein